MLPDTEDALYSRDRFLQAVRLVNAGKSCEEIFQTLTTDISEQIRLKGILVYRFNKLGELDLRFISGFSEDFKSRYQTISMKQNIPATAAIKDCKTLVLESPERIIKAFPASVDWDYIPGTLICVPLIYNAEVCGVMSFSFTVPMALIGSKYRKDEIILTLEAMAEISQLAFGRYQSMKNSKPETGHTNSQLNNRQKQILELVCKGARNKDIARELNFSPATIRLEISKIFSLLGVKSRQEAAFAAKKYLDSKLSV